MRSLGKEVNLNPPLTLGQLPDTPEELLKLDQVFIKSELKVGVIYVKEVSIDPHIKLFIKTFHRKPNMQISFYTRRVNFRKNKF